jgi:hypothetical protein
MTAEEQSKFCCKSSKNKKRTSCNFLCSKSIKRHTNRVSQYTNSVSFWGLRPDPLNPTEGSAPGLLDTRAKRARHGAPKTSSSSRHWAHVNTSKDQLSWLCKNISILHWDIYYKQNILYKIYTAVYNCIYYYISLSLFYLKSVAKKLRSYNSISHLIYTSFLYNVCFWHSV